MDFKNVIPISPNMLIVESLQKKVILDKPEYIGMQILDLSKILMYDFYYNNIKAHFKRTDLIMTDTDSLFVLVECEENRDAYDIQIEQAHLYDFSDVQPGCALFQKIQVHCEKNGLDFKTFVNENKKVVGKMKNKVGNSEIVEAVSIKSKCYDFLTKDNETHKKLMGINYGVAQDDISHED